MTYKEKLLDPRWQKKRLSILNRDNFTCQYCSSADKTLMVHHTYYEKSKDPWEASDDNLITLCVDCHEYFHESMNKDYDIIKDMMALKLKDPFITKCASDFFKNIQDLNQIIFLLWDCMDFEDELICALKKINNTDINKYKLNINS